MNPYKDAEESSFNSSVHISYEDIASKLLKDHRFLTALELHTELVESGRELPQLREFFSNPGNFEQHVTRASDFTSMHRTPSLATLDSLDTARYSEDGGGDRAGSGGEVAVLEFELRKAKETINALRANLTQFAGRHVEGHWVLGMIEDGSEDLRLEVCPDNIRSAEVLVPLILKNVEVGTTIHTDFWKAYDCLSEHGYIHKKVNHSDRDNPFIAEDGTHTQRIESQWRAIKRFFKKDNFNNRENFPDLLFEYLWRRNNMKYGKDPFVELIKAIRHVYKV